METTVTVRTPAKINLILDILGKRTDGYHFMKTIMQSVSIYDKITVDINSTGRITAFCNAEGVPCDEKNTVVKAAKEFFSFNNIETTGLEIIIDKTIPVQAGLAGGSSDAAGVLVALNELYQTGLSNEQLCDIGEKIGADVPFCIIGGTALAEGIGELLTPLPELSDCYIVIAKGEKGISTVEAFEKYDKLSVLNHPDSDGMIAAIAAGNLKETAALCINVFESLADIQDICDIKKTMLEYGALCSIMTGSGSAVFGIFEKKKYANACADELDKYYSFSKVCTPVKSGAEIV